MAQRLKDAYGNNFKKAYYHDKAGNLMCVIRDNDVWKAASILTGENKFYEITPDLAKTMMIILDPYRYIDFLEQNIIFIKSGLERKLIKAKPQGGY